MTKAGSVGRPGLRGVILYPVVQFLLLGGNLGGVRLVDGLAASEAYKVLKVRILGVQALLVYVDDVVPEPAADRVELPVVGVDYIVAVPGVYGVVT